MLDFEPWLHPVENTTLAVPVGGRRHDAEWEGCAAW
jgi:hypothetical protein